MAESKKGIEELERIIRFSRKIALSLEYYLPLLGHMPEDDYIPPILLRQSDDVLLL